MRPTPGPAAGGARPGPPRPRHRFASGSAGPCSGSGCRRGTVEPHLLAESSLLSMKYHQKHPKTGLNRRFRSTECGLPMQFGARCSRGALAGAAAGVFECLGGGGGGAKAPAAAEAPAKALHRAICARSKAQSEPMTSLLRRSMLAVSMLLPLSST